MAFTVLSVMFWIAFWTAVIPIAAFVLFVLGVIFYFGLKELGLRGADGVKRILSVGKAKAKRLMETSRAIFRTLDRITSTLVIIFVGIWALVMIVGITELFWLWLAQ